MTGSNSSSSPTLLKLRAQSPSGNDFETTESQENNQTVISQVESSHGSASPIRVKVEAEEKLEFEPMQLHVERKPLQSSSSRYQTVSTHSSTGGESASGITRIGESASGITRETSTRTRNVPELKEQRVEFSRSSSKSSSRQKGTSKTSEL